MAHRPLRPGQQRQRGAALLTAMIIVTLVATLAAAMVWQQWRAVQVETAERARTQSAWVLSGALDFARRILREDKKPFTGLTEPWATPLAESRLSTFLAADNADPDDGPEAFLSGYITDVQGRYNVFNLNQGDADQAAWELQTMTELCQLAQVDVGIAQRLQAGMRLAFAAKPTSAAPLQPATVAQLAWLGIDAASLKALEPYIVVLPITTALNVNTASPAVLAAVTHLDQGTAAGLVAMAAKTPFQNRNDLTSKPAFKDVKANLDVRSFYYEIRGRIRLADHVLIEKSLVHKNLDGSSVVLQRERVASLEQPGS